MYIQIYIYIYICREREGERETCFRPRLAVVAGDHREVVLALEGKDNDNDNNSKYYC